MSTYEEDLQAMTDEELSKEWVAVMTTRNDPQDRESQLAAVDSVTHEINQRYENGGFSSLIVSAKDARTVTEHFKTLIGAGEVDWFGEKETEEA